MHEIEPATHGSVPEVSPARSPAITYYPVYMHHAHPLHNHWVSLTAKVFRELEIPTGWGASHPGSHVPGAAPTNTTEFPLYHYLNHPLPYIQLCGIVVDIQLQGRGWWEIRLDDSSGVLVDALIKKMVDTEADVAEIPKANTNTEYAESGQIITPPIPQWRCVGWLNKAELDIRPIAIGITLRVKGRVNSWRFGNQILVEKFDIFKGTSKEVKFWQSMNCDFVTILQKPWIITETRLQELEAQHEKAKEEEETLARKQERRARRERKGKSTVEVKKQKRTAIEDNDHAGNERSEVVQDVEGAHDSSSSAAKHPVQAGLAPSFQVPQENSNSATSSAETQSSTCIKDNRKFLAKDLIVPILGKCNTTSKEKPARASILDTASPSYWKRLKLDADENDSRAFYGSDWAWRRNTLLGQIQDCGQQKASRCLGESFIDTASPSAWDNLDLNDDDKVPKHIVTGTKWLAARSNLIGFRAAASEEGFASKGTSNGV